MNPVEFLEGVVSTISMVMKRSITTAKSLTYTFGQILQKESIHFQINDVVSIINDVVSSIYSVVSSINDDDLEMDAEKTSFQAGMTMFLS